MFEKLLERDVAITRPEMFENNWILWIFYLFLIMSNTLIDDNGGLLTALIVLDFNRNERILPRLYEIQSGTPPKGYYYINKVTLEVTIFS